MSSETESSPTAISDETALVNSSLEGDDDVASRSEDDGAQTLRIPEAVSDSEEGPTLDNVSRDTPAGYSNEAWLNRPMCRICHEGDQEKPLVSPCNCSGTIGFVHVTCLEDWLNRRNVDFCELCGYRFQMVAQPGSALRLLYRVLHSEDSLRRVLMFELLLWTIMIVVTVRVVVLTRVALEKRQSDRLLERARDSFYITKVTTLLYSIYWLMSKRMRYLYYLYLEWQLEHRPVRRLVAMPFQRGQ
ncbi:hypothetical protein HPB50_025175 [Hyalomma asiaticum]|uniref:Uncharacterized protein n=1 Tax=Hyalomma asiaticum TaxID=266040 RepID=A0ACB7TUE7_HYAAI|nr:hypothetical protein HPB50_025175 [Hyalomma asiaticum]